MLETERRRETERDGERRRETERDGERRRETETELHPKLQNFKLHPKPQNYIQKYKITKNYKTMVSIFVVVLLFIFTFIHYIINFKFILYYFEMFPC